MAVAPPILSSAKLKMLIRAVKDSYDNAPTTLIATLTECRVIHITLSKIQRLIHKDETGLSSKLTAQEILREAFDGALTGCRMTLAALSLELGKLAQPKKGTKTTELSLQTKARLVWKENIMKQLLDQTRGQMSSLHYLIELLESETQAEILRSMKQNRADIRKVLHQAKSIRSERGIDDDQSPSNFAHQSVDYGLVPSYEAQYQWAKTAAAEELLARKIELMDENYALEETVENLLLDADLKDERVSQLEGDILSRDKRVNQLEGDVLSRDKRVSNLNDYILKKDEEVSQLKDEVSLRDGRIATLENAISTKDEYLLAKEKRISELEDAMVQKDEVVDIQKETSIDWTADSMHTKAVNQILKEEADIQADDRGKCMLLTLAADLGYVKVFKWLLDSGVDIETRDKIGHLLLYLAASSGHVKVVETLLRKNANAEAATHNRWTPLHMVATHAEIEKTLLEEGANLEAAGKGGWTPLFAATQFGHVDLAKILLDKGANIETADEYGRTPLLVATQFGHVGRRYHLSSTREGKKKKKRKLASAHPILEYPSLTRRNPYFRTLIHQTLTSFTAKESPEQD